MKDKVEDKSADKDFKAFDKTDATIFYLRLCINQEHINIDMYRSYLGTGYLIYMFLIIYAVSSLNAFMPTAPQHAQHCSCFYLQLVLVEFVMLSLKFFSQCFVDCYWCCTCFHIVMHYLSLNAR